MSQTFVSNHQDYYNSLCPLLIWAEGTYYILIGTSMLLVHTPLIFEAEKSDTFKFLSIPKSRILHLMLFELRYLKVFEVINLALNK